MVGAGLLWVGAIHAGCALPAYEAGTAAAGTGGAGAGGTTGTSVGGAPGATGSGGSGGGLQFACRVNGSHTVVDDFDDNSLDPVLWTHGSGVPQELDGQLVLPISQAQPSVWARSAAPYDLRDCSV
jgi:hypothetical protein